MVKRKATVALSLLDNFGDDDDDNNNYFGGDAVVVNAHHGISQNNAGLETHQASTTTTWRMCTPSPPISPQQQEERNVPDLTPRRRHPDKSIESILRQGPNKKRKFSLDSMQTKELVVEEDAPITASTSYEMLLFSQMTLGIRQGYPTFRCRLCGSLKDAAAISFVCMSLECLEASVPHVDHHLVKECPQAPSWLKDKISQSKPSYNNNNNQGQSSTCRPFLHWIWQRMLNQVCGGNSNNTKRVRFAETHEERIIPRVRRVIRGRKRSRIGRRVSGWPTVSVPHTKHTSNYHVHCPVS